LVNDIITPWTKSVLGCNGVCCEEAEIPYFLAPIWQWDGIVREKLHIGAMLVVREFVTD